MKNLAEFKNTYTLDSDDRASTYTWLTTSSLGIELSTVLPKTVRDFYDYFRVDLAIGDNDPVYWAVHRAFRSPHYGTAWAKRFSVAMLLYYRTDVAFRAANRGDEFWEYLHEIYPTAPRGTERRYFRGEQGLRVMESVEKFGSPSQFIQAVTAHSAQSFMGVRDFCQTYLAGFGPYFQLKVCDYLDRCLERPITNYAKLGRYLSREPENTLKEMYPDLPAQFAFDKVCEEVSNRYILAGPDMLRWAGPAEVETVLCDYHTAKYRGNWLGYDTGKKRAQLAGSEFDSFRELFQPVIPEGTFKCEL